jgi:carbonic anhydrase
MERARETIWELAQGNKRFVQQRGHGNRPQQNAPTTSLVEKLIEDPLKPSAARAIVLSCARSYAPIDSIFDTQPGDIQVIRVIGGVCKPRDGVVGSTEFALASALKKNERPVLMVLGNSRNDVIEEAVVRAMIEAGRGDDAPSSHEFKGQQDVHLGILDSVSSSVKDALLQEPNGSFERLCELTTKLNSYAAIETLISTSRNIFDMVLTGTLTVIAGYFDVDTGRVSFLGEHPAKHVLLKTPPPKETVRTASDPPVPAEEALATMFSGNMRYAIGKGGQSKVEDKQLLVELSEGGQNPASIVVGCADSRAPIEILFDVKPGDLFVLRNAGNTCASAKGSLIGSAEYAISHLRTKLVIVTGHTKCGAVTAALQTVAGYLEKNGKTVLEEDMIGDMVDSLKTVAGSIGDVLANIVLVAAETIRMMPNASLGEKIVLATKLNVFSTIEKIIRFSDIVRKPAIIGEVKVHGGVYDIFTGKVEWLGEHPQMAEIVGQPMPLHTWTVTPYTRLSVPPNQISAGATSAIARLKRGNQRFLRGEYHPTSTGEVPDPFAIVIGGAEVRVPIEKIFDVGPGDLVVQRCMGSIAGRTGATLFDSIEYGVVRFAPRLLMVMGESDSDVITSALGQVTGNDLPSSAMRSVLDRVMVSTMRAQQQVDADPAATAAGRVNKIRQLSVELNVLYTIEQLMSSPTIRYAVRHFGLEVHACVLNERTGEVDFVGRHPQQAELLNEARYPGQKANMEPPKATPPPAVDSTPSTTSAM